MSFRQSLDHRRARILLLATVCAVFAPVLLRGDVIFAHDNAPEVGFPAAPGPERISNRKFLDQSSIFVPELQQHLRGDHAGWLSLWNPHGELGRPTQHVSGFSRAYLPTNLLGAISQDPFRVYTALAVCAVLLTALFGYQLLASLRLHPAACLAGAVGLGLGVFVGYWLTFVMFVWGIAWTLALLWMITRYVERPGLPSLFGIAFAVHALLLSGYPQQIVWHAYLVTGYALYRLLRAPEGLARKGLRALELGAAAGLGLVSAAPVYLDLRFDAARSARLDTPPEFFLAALPRLENPGAILHYFGQVVDAFWIGNPIRPEYAAPFDGLCLTPLFAGLVAVCLSPRLLRRVWPALGFLALGLLATLWSPAYRFGVERAGLGISRFLPLAGALIPAYVLAALAADQVIRHAEAKRLRLALASLPAAVVLLAGTQVPAPLQPGFVAAGGAFLLATLAFVWTRSPALLVLVSLLGALHYGARLPLTRPLGEIHRSSPLVERIRTATAPGARFAWVAKDRRTLLLPPNQEALLGLRSIHTYNSLSSRLYQDWVRGISRRGTFAQGRHFLSISDPARLAAPEFGFAGVGLLLSTRPLPEALGARRQGLLHEMPGEVRLEAQVARFETRGSAATIPGRLVDAPRLEVRRSLQHDDRLLFETSAAERPTLLFVSQQYHPRWEAHAGAEGLATVLVNGFYQGVLLPPGTTRVDLRFRPWARWSWIPQLAFVLGGSVLLVRWLVSSQGGRGARRSGAPGPIVSSDA